GRTARDSFVLLLLPRPLCAPLFPYTTLFRSTMMAPAPAVTAARARSNGVPESGASASGAPSRRSSEKATRCDPIVRATRASVSRSEEHTSELQSRFDLVCRLLLEKKNNRTNG